MRLVVGMLISLILTSFLVGCEYRTKEVPTYPELQKQSKNPQEKDHEYKNQIPDKIKGTYYRTVASSSDSSDDEFWKLQIGKRSLVLKQAGMDSEIDWDQVKVRKLSDNSYIVEHDEQYIKLVYLSQNKIDISTEVLDAPSYVIGPRRMNTFTTNRPTGYFGLLRQTLIRQKYTSSLGIERYYSFNENPMGSQLIEVSSDGKISVLANYEILAAKNNGYILGHRDNDETTILVPLANDQLKDLKTGEIFSHYQKGDIQLQQDIRNKLGFEPKFNDQADNSQTKVIKKEYPKTFDFADDKDDDYYDTYDDFDLNNGN